MHKSFTAVTENLAYYHFEKFFVDFSHFKMGFSDLEGIINDFQFISIDFVKLS